MRLHVLGIGSIGTLISHNLRLSNPTTPISLVVKKASAFPSTRVRRDDAPPIRLSVERGEKRSTSRGFDLEVWHDGRAIEIPQGHGEERQAGPWGPGEPNGPIDSLIVCLKAPSTLPALRILAPRLSPTSVITLLQNGMGVYDQLCSSLFSDPTTRPFFVLGTTTHGVSQTGKQGSVRHMSRPGEGEIKWGVVPHPRAELDLEQWLWGYRASDAPILTPPESPTLPLAAPPSGVSDLRNLHTTLTALMSMRYLSPSLLPMPHLHHQLLLKLAANATINPLTAILGGGALPNSSLMSSDPAYRLIGLLTRETSEILTAYLHNLSSPHTPPPDVLRLFSAESLEKRIFALCRATAENISSMAVDVGNGKQTEIEHINGYLVSLGSRLGVPTPNHRLVTEMVKFSAGMNGLDANAPGIYRKGLRQWHRDLREITDTKTKERTLALEEKKLELEERRIKLLEAERQEGLVARRAEMKAKQRITQRRYRAARLAAKLGITDLPEGARSSDMLGVPRPEDVAEPVTMGVASSATDAEEGQVSAEPAEAAHWAGVGSQDFVDVVSGIASSKRQS